MTDLLFTLGASYAEVASAFYILKLGCYTEHHKGKSAMECKCQFDAVYTKISAKDPVTLILPFPLDYLYNRALGRLDGDFRE